MDTKLLEKKMESISPFELKNRLIDMADESLKKTARTMLNAGRGNPSGGKIDVDSQIIIHLVSF